MKNDLVARVESIRDRTQVSDHYSALFSLAILRNRLDRVETSNADVLGYFPVATVAHLEVFFKHALRDLLDEGDPFINRADDLLRRGKIKLDSSLAAAIAGRRVTFGELIAESLGYSNLNTVSGYFTALLGSDFLAAVREAHGRDDSTLTPDFGQMMAMVQELYEARHIIAHEVRPRLQLSQKTVTNWITASTELLHASATVIRDAMYPEGLPTQAQMTESSTMAAETTVDVVKDLYGKLAERFPAEGRSITSLGREWESWARAMAALVGDILASGGTLEPQLRAEELVTIAEEEEWRLNELLRRLEGMTTQND